MKTLVVFLAGFAAGWLALGWALRQLRLARPDITGTISGPDGDWEIKGLTMTRLPVQP